MSWTIRYVGRDQDPFRHHIPPSKRRYGGVWFISRRKKRR